MSWADLMQCALLSASFLMIGDPGQIPPVVTIDVRRWETSPRAPHEAAPEVVLADPSFVDVRFVGSLPACRRLPHESVEFVKPFYDFDFVAYVDAGAPRSRPAQRPPARSARRWPPDGAHRADARARATDRGRPRHRRRRCRGGRRSARLGSQGPSRERRADRSRRSDIGVSSSHRVMNSALAAALWRSGAAQLRVDTPERWQGLERPVMIAVHPLSGVTDPSAFDLETGRLCVMASRHQSALIVLARDHVGDTLANFVPSAGQAPGRPDVVGRGHDAHLRFWEALVGQDRIRPVS